MKNTFIWFKQIIEYNGNKLNKKFIYYAILWNLHWMNALQKICDFLLLLFIIIISLKKIMNNCC